MRQNAFTILFLLLILQSCKNVSDTSAYSAEAVLIQPDGFSSEGIDQETLQMIIQTGDHIDYMFNTIPLSMNQDGQPAVFKDLSFVSTLPMKGIPERCSPLARKIILSKGEIIMEADLYFTQECVFQIFIMDEKPLYGNQLTAEGIAFYNNLMRQADETMPDQFRKK